MIFIYKAGKMDKIAFNSLASFKKRAGVKTIKNEDEFMERVKNDQTSWCCIKNEKLIPFNNMEDCRNCYYES